LLIMLGYLLRITSTLFYESVASFCLPSSLFLRSIFFFTDPAPPENYPLSLHDALPIFASAAYRAGAGMVSLASTPRVLDVVRQRDRKSTRLNSSHEWISYAVFCLKKKKTQQN